ncbi:MAG TPA: GAF domain-containing protein [Ktedonobacteraceae bacterium]|nr:GAF domain-containing protein [Ktedonobacteraceae bacterium]
MQLWQGYRSFSAQDDGRENALRAWGVGETGIGRRSGGTGLDEGRGELGKGIASVCYADVLRAYANLTGVLRFWAICNLVLRQAREQLDPQRLGIEVTIVRCLPPYKGKKIRSMYECLRIATPEEHSQDDTLLFLGAESLAGYAVTMGRPAVIQNLASQNACGLGENGQAFKRSMAAYPIIRAGEIAGCFVATSVRSDYFLETERLQQLQCYTEVIALAFEPEEFYEPERIELCVMPSEDVQRHYLASMQQRIARIMTESVVASKPINSLEAERLAWEQLEEELFERPRAFEE